MKNKLTSLSRSGLQNWWFKARTYPENGMVLHLKSNHQHSTESWKDY
jgi:hypothetical protein